MLRPTVSPIVFKWQIGRGLFASKKTDAVIFDIVMNINNFYSIGTVEEEMKTAVAYYRSLGESDEFVQEQKAKNYYLENGDLEVSARYMTEDGIRLGVWIDRMRKLRQGRCRGAALTQEQIERLNAIGMTWEKRSDQVWEKHFSTASQYAGECGTCWSRYLM